MGNINAAAVEVETFPEGTTRAQMLDMIFKEMDAFGDGFLPIKVWECICSWFVLGAEVGDDQTPCEVFDSLKKAGKEVSDDTLKYDTHKLSFKEFSDETLKSCEADSDEDFAKKAGRWLGLAKVFGKQLSSELKKM